MGLEKDLKRRIRLGRIQKAILTTIAVSGTLLVAVAAPNLVQLLGSTDRFFNARKTSAIRKLRDEGLIVFETRDSQTFLTLTAKGRRFVDQSFFITKPRRWDGRWRLVIFDIPVHRSVYRRALRAKLQEIGFEKLQASVWAFPYDCEELVTLLKADFGLGKEVLYIIADSIENDRALRGRFGLRKK